MSSNALQKAMVITGAFGALGAATARAGARSGARMVLVDQAPQPPMGLMEECGADARALGGVDLTDASAAAAALDTAYTHMGRVDVLINIAGAFRWQTVADGDPESWDFLFRINVKTALNCARAALPYLKRSGVGRVINVGALAANRAQQGMGAYAASKSAVHRLTESLAEELKDDRITVNAVLPSIIDTPSNRGQMPDADHSRWVAPEALAAVILFLASDEAEAITGVLLPVTGRV
jgi:NAD(P)-dependent dehydrogenase (short-subunit alcohol dehydrogenase family)